MFYSTGEIAKKAATFHFDLMKGKGTFVDYSLYSDQDGSTNEFNASSHPVGTPLSAGSGRGLGVCFVSVLLP